MLGRLDGSLPAVWVLTPQNRNGVQGRYETNPTFQDVQGHVETYLDFGGLRGETVWESFPTCHGSPDGTGAAAVVRKAQNFSRGAVQNYCCDCEIVDFVGFHV